MAVFRGNGMPDMPDDTDISCAQTAEQWTYRDAVWAVGSGGPKEAYIRWRCRSPCEGAIFREKATTICRELCKNGQTDRDAVWVVNSDRTVRVRLRCGLMSKYVDHLSVFKSVVCTNSLLLEAANVN